MTDNRKPIDDDALDGISVTPPRPDADDDAESDRDRVDVGSEDSMDASDPPSTSAPGSDRDVDQAREQSRQNDA